MVDKEVKLSAKNQIVIPKEARDYVHLKAGDRLVLTISSAGHLLLWKRPKDYTSYMKGLGRQLWKNTDVASYIKKLRKDWR
ncbi:hypothetical protein A3J44_01040 [candidate division WOR-1 bacterium RIFCSPHIGHO2_02_FULL_45_12]|uniref:SpoVT-AbrB domain-containing protein n=1 Tax=candidate division WOR-1 bacterium RIFCSPLOWO2_12_FULL_45_9 TaxID=1802568 RepID=A0A1F4RM17_UNCSA|nr:MAG: hypothetical protein A3J44_01040 [candidate division WOR-1 bacterium RIFCSPHIGHO2_02_FULL_45_12]OGC09264.1 MAG: hypothetical protein A3F86_02750 [candidate division WOR-1 bacterium RIFCSPLOWO2_12_FULL_45_9]